MAEAGRFGPTLPDSTSFQFTLLASTVDVALAA
jgi:hypothetical protein